MPGIITFRTHLLGSVNDFAEACSMGPLVRPAVLIELIVALSRYTEEGKKLSPDVYLCDGINELLKRVPDHGMIYIGELRASEESIVEILKECAPLAIGGWCIFIEGREEKFNYGLFRDSLNPLTIPMEEILLSSGSNEIKVVRVHQLAQDCVEIRSHRGDAFNIFLSHKKEDSPLPTKFLSSLVESICERVAEKEIESVKTFLIKSFHDSLSSSNGALIAVCHKSKVPRFLSDGIHLSEPIDFVKNVQDVRDRGVPFSTLISEASLMKGMISCDGIVAFSCEAKILAYNCFVPSVSEKGRVSGGGARKRAFAALCNRLGKELCAAFIQSHDGWTDFRRDKNE